MKILLIEDDAAIAKVIMLGLHNERIDVSIANNGLTGLKMATAGNYDLLLIDLMLPDKNGAEIVSQLRNAQINTPIIILTALGELQTKIKLFNLGADDYMVKPFEFEELLARIKSSLRKQKIELAEIIIFGDVKLDLRKHQATRNRLKLDLREKELKLLEYFMRHPDQVLTREMLFNYAWGPTAERYTNVVDVHVHYLRDKLDKPFGSKLIKTVSSIGYKMNKE